MIDGGDCGAIGGMKIGRGNRSTRRKPAPAPLCPPQIPHDQTRARTRAAAVGSQRLTAIQVIVRLLPLQLKGCNIGIIDVEGFMKYTVEIVRDDMIYVHSFTSI
jgi:hypothetical protein